MTDDKKKPLLMLGGSKKPSSAILNKALNTINNMNSRPPKIIIDDPIKEESENLDFSLNDFDFVEDVAESPTLLAATNKAPKDSLIDFLKLSVLDEDYNLVFNGTYDSAKAFIHRMRVELSRMRAQVIKLNKPLDHFHILTKNIVVESETVCTITLIKTYNRQRFDTAKIESDVLSFLTIPES